MHLNTGFSPLRAFGKSPSISCRTLDCQLSNEEPFLSLVAVGFISLPCVVKSETRAFTAHGADTISELTRLRRSYECVCACRRRVTPRPPVIDV